MQYWGQIQQVGFATSLQLQTTIFSILVGGKQVIKQAEPILKDLAKELKGTTKDSVAVVKKTIDQLQKILADAVSAPLKSKTNSLVL